MWLSHCLIPYWKHYHSIRVHSSFWVQTGTEQIFLQVSFVFFLTGVGCVNVNDITDQRGQQIYFVYSVLCDWTLTVQQHSRPAQVLCWTCVLKLTDPPRQLSQRKLQRSTLLFQTFPPSGLHIPGWRKLKLVERKKSGRYEFPLKHPCLSPSEVAQRLVRHSKFLQQRFSLLNSLSDMWWFGCV